MKTYEDITILGKSLYEFNNQYHGSCSIVEAEKIFLKGFWLAIDSDGNECGMFTLKNNALIETPWSSGKYRFMHRISSGILPIPSKKEIGDNPFSLFKNENFTGLKPPKKRKPETEKTVPTTDFRHLNNMEKPKNTCNSELNRALKHLNPYDDHEVLAYKNTVSDVARIIEDCAKYYPNDLNKFMIYARSCNWSVVWDAVEKIKVNKYKSCSSALIESIVTAHEDAKRGFSFNTPQSKITTDGQKKEVLSENQSDNDVPNITKIYISDHFFNALKNIKNDSNAEKSEDSHSFDLD